MSFAQKKDQLPSNSGTGCQELINQTSICYQNFSDKDNNKLIEQAAVCVKLLLMEFWKAPDIASIFLPERSIAFLRAYILSEGSYLLLGHQFLLTGVQVWQATDNLPLEVFLQFIYCNQMISGKKKYLQSLQF